MKKDGYIIATEDIGRLGSRSWACLMMQDMATAWPSGLSSRETIAVLRIR